MIARPFRRHEIDQHGLRERRCRLGRTGDYRRLARSHEVPATRVLEFEAHPFEAGLQRIIHARTLSSGAGARCSQVHNGNVCASEQRPIGHARTVRPMNLRGAIPSWAANLGQQHGARARATELALRATRDAAVDGETRALSRWPRIVEAMTRLVTAYNTAFGRESLNISEDRSVTNRPVVTIRAGGADAPSLVVTLEESVLCARRSDSGGLSRETEYRLRDDRDDDETAAYVLQHWMEHL